MTGPGARRRLHPLSPLLHSAKALAVIVAAISWQGYAELGPVRWLCTVAVLLVAAGLWSVVSWHRTGYRVTGPELRVDEGLLWRRSRAIPLARLQTVEVRRPPLARLFGLAELRLEVAGGTKTEAPLAYLALAEAVWLRDLLLAQVPAAPHAAVGAPVLHRVDNRDLVVAQLLTPELWALPLGVAFVLYQAAGDARLGLIALGSTATALLAVVAQPVRRTLRDWHFTVTRGPAGLAVTHGLVEQRQQLVPADRVHSVRAVWPLLWRHRRWLRLHLDVAGARAASDDQPVDLLLPVGVPQVAGALVEAVVPGCGWGRLPLAPPPWQARWLAPLAAPRLGLAVTERVVAVRSGVLTRRLTLVSRARMQSVRVTAGPWQRRLGLATLHVDTGAGSVAAAHRAAAEAWDVAARLAAGALPPSR